MFSLIAKLNLAFILACATTSEAAVIEIDNPAPRTSQAPNARFLHWQAMARDIGFLDGDLNSARRGKTGASPAGANLLHVANASVPGAGEAAFPLYQDYYWRMESGASMTPSTLEESVHTTEVWPIVIIAIGLIAYQLRRQSRNRSGVVRISSGRP